MATEVPVGARAHGARAGFEHRREAPLIGRRALRVLDFKRGVLPARRSHQPVAPLTRLIPGAQIKDELHSL